MEAARWRLEHPVGPACRGCEGRGCVVSIHPATRLELARDVGWPTVASVPGRPRQLSVAGIRVVMDTLVPAGDAVAGPCLECLTVHQAPQRELAPRWRRAAGGG